MFFFCKKHILRINYIMADTNSIPLTGWEKQKHSVMKKPLNDNNVNNRNIKYVIVLAGGLQDNGEVHEFVKLRLDKAIEIYNEIHKNGEVCKIVAMGGGTYHKPPVLNEDKYTIHESTACANYLYKTGIPHQHIYREWSSYDTIANGYYAYLNYIQPLNIKEFILITSEFHMPRAKVIFDYFNDIMFQSHINIQYIETENQGIDSNVLMERCERECKSTSNFKKNIVEQIHNIRDFSRWLYEEHGAYKSIIYYEQNDKINKSY